MENKKRKKICDYVKLETEKRNKKECELEELNKKIKLLSTVLEYKKKERLSKIFKDDKASFMSKKFKRKYNVKISDLIDLRKDVIYFSARITNLSDEQGKKFYKILFGKNGEKIQKAFMRDVQQFQSYKTKPISSYLNLETYKIMKHTINVAATLSIMFEEYYKLLKKQSKLQNELLNIPLKGELKRLIKKIECLEMCYFSEKDIQTIRSISTISTRQKKQLETFIIEHNNNWKKDQQQKKLLVEQIKKLEVKKSDIINENITLIREENFKIEECDSNKTKNIEKLKENDYVNSLVQLLLSEQNLDTIKHLLPTREFKDYYNIQKELIENIDKQIELLKSERRNTEDSLEQELISSEIDRIKIIYKFIKDYFKIHEKETESNFSGTVIERENELIYLFHQNGASYLIQDLSDNLSKEQIPHFMKALSYIKKGNISFNQTKLNKFSAAKGFFGASDIFEAKEKQVRIIFQYLGDHKIGILMYFNKDSNETTIKQREAIKNRVLNCKDQVEYLRNKIGNKCLDSQILEYYQGLEKDILSYIGELDVNFKKNRLFLK